MEIKYRWNKFDMSNSIVEFKNSPYAVKERVKLCKKLLIWLGILLMISVILFKDNIFGQELLVVFAATILIGSATGEYGIYIFLLIAALILKFEKDDKSLLINDSDMKYSTRGNLINIPYNAVVSIEESKSYFRIWCKDGQKYILIPKRVVEDKDLFVSLLEEKTSLKFESL